METMEKRVAIIHRVIIPDEGFSEGIRGAGDGYKINFHSSEEN